jgi:hypothetical protein
MWGALASFLGRGLAAMTARFDRIKERLSALVGVGYMTHRLSDLALAEIDARWDDLSADDVPQLDAWLRGRQSVTTNELRVEWTYILDAYASVLQVRDPSSALLANLRSDRPPGVAHSPHNPPSLPADFDGLATPRDELPLLEVVPPREPPPKPLERPAMARRRRNSRRKRSARKGGALRF